MSENGQNSSESNGFNFENPLDISIGKKQKTGELFKQRLYDFQDFNNIGDSKTLKSQKTSKKFTNSDLLKKSFDSNLVPSEHMGTNNNQLGFFNHNNKLDYTSQNFKSPKFGSVAQQQSMTQHLFTLRPVKLIQKPQQKQKQLGHNKKNQQIKRSQYNQKDKHIEQYLSLCDQINYYSQATQNIEFQNKRLREGIENLVYKLNYQMQSNQIKMISEDIARINEDIEQQRTIQKKLIQVHEQLEQQYEQIVHSINTLTFNRPQILTAQTKIILDQINTLKAQFDAMQRDDGSLNLSTTVRANPNHEGDRFQHQQEPPLLNGEPVSQCQKLLREIQLQDQLSDDPKYLHNIKMACLKDQWILFSNSVLQISISYRMQNKIKINIGNKNSCDLYHFSILQEGQIVIDNQVLSNKSYYIHAIRKNHYLKPFIKISIKYKIINSQKKQIRLFIPNMELKYGQFIPFTKKQFNLENQSILTQVCGLYRPIDKSIIRKLSQIKLYLPNLEFNQSENQCKGIFKSTVGQGALINLTENDELIKIWIKNWNYGMLKILQFIFTI